MPYAFAHPVAVIPLYRLLGRFAVPSALVIGSVIPDAWYFVPLLSRAGSHSVGGLLLFCLPAGLFTYAAFHLIFKQPLLGLLPQAVAGRLRAWSSAYLPEAPWPAVVVSIVAGALTHFAWDALTHEGAVVEAFPALEAVVLAFGAYELRAHQVLQHASTVLGTGLLAWWTWQKLRTAPTAPPSTVPMPATARTAIVALLAIVAAFGFSGVAVEALPSSSVEGLRGALRAAAVTAVSALGLATTAYCVLWRWLNRGTPQ